MASIAAKKQKTPSGRAKQPVPKNARNWVRGLGKIFARVALFQVDGTLARVVAVKGLPRAPVGDSVSLIDQTPLRWAVEAASPIVGAGRSPGAMIIPVALGVPTPRAFAVIPLVVERKLIALAYVDNGQKAFGVSNVSELFDFCSQLLDRKRKIVKPRLGIRSTVRRTGISRFRIPGLQGPSRPHRGTPEPHGLNLIRLDEPSASDASHSETIGHAIAEALRQLAQEPDTLPGIAGSVLEAAAPPNFARAPDSPPSLGSASVQPLRSSTDSRAQPAPAPPARAASSQDRSGHEPKENDGSPGRRCAAPGPVPAAEVPCEPCLTPAAIEALAADVAQETMDDIRPTGQTAAVTGLFVDGPAPGTAKNRSLGAAQNRPFGAAQDRPLVPGADGFENLPTPPPLSFDAPQQRPSEATRERRRLAEVQPRAAATPQPTWDTPLPYAPWAYEQPFEGDQKGPSEKTPERPFDGNQVWPFAATQASSLLTEAPANLVVTPQGIRRSGEAARTRKPFHWRRLAAAIGSGLILLLISGLVTMAPASEVAGNRMIEILPHSTLSEIAEQLHNERLISSSKGFCMLARLSGVDRQLRAGTYRLPTGAWAWTVLGELHSGQVHTKTVTIPEGYTLREIASLLERTGLVSSSRLIKEARNPELLRRFGITAPSAEGYLFPETYTIAEGTSERDILSTILEQFFTRLRSLPPAQGLTREAVFDRLILASIVEREARTPEERQRIAGVFQNRIDRNMRLESCATVQYILQRPKAHLRHADLRIKSPYNTYLNEGLPPGPIANPGLEAIAAALAPEKHEYLFFVARDDGTNRHIFTKSYTAHEAVLARLRKRR